MACHCNVAFVDPSCSASAVLIPCTSAASTPGSKGLLPLSDNRWRPAHVGCCGGGSRPYPGGQSVEQAKDVATELRQSFATAQASTWLLVVATCCRNCTHLACHIAAQAIGASSRQQLLSAKCHTSCCLIRQPMSRFYFLPSQLTTLLGGGIEHKR